MLSMLMGVDQTGATVVAACKMPQSCALKASDRAIQSTGLCIRMSGSIQDTKRAAVLF